jgi:hypothetical protein
MAFDPSDDPDEDIDDSGAPGVDGLPDDIAGRLTYTPDSEDDDFDKSQQLLGSKGSETQQHLAAIQAARAKIDNWLSTFHGAEPKSVDNLRQQVAGGKISNADYYAMTGRVYSGDSATRDARGNITGYTFPDGSGSVLGGPSGTPGLDAFHEMNPDVPSSPGFSFLPDSPTSVPALPGSVVARVDSPTPGHAMAADTLTYDTRLQAPTGDTIQGPTSNGTQSSLSSNNRLAGAAWTSAQRTANASLRSDYKAAGLPDPTIPASVLRFPGQGASVVPGNRGAQPWQNR